MAATDTAKRCFSKSQAPLLLLSAMHPAAQNTPPGYHNTTLGCTLAGRFLRRLRITDGGVSCTWSDGHFRHPIKKLKVGRVASDPSASRHFAASTAQSPLLQLPTDHKILRQWLLLPAQRSAPQDPHGDDAQAIGRANKF
ncbi:predicted protein [Chaetomium globosum CBS 148.51]|uniref:Uncharacterized protein n=1 Tax=Chaetomium globosum (strain ATCC 6205 / CBS 148.51 / DSM 1962 / NBRC 6347 / NRRL 1970) TaxID=306901 RepID=Q2HEZ8_CHAGB|nr:uncharacterized protein CHGG_01206 [Chaetomium globosum CBS 148.51]EAQ92971.1 predicted protein [Chaetomium globosum CBS 148.51]